MLRNGSAGNWVGRAFLFLMGLAMCLGASGAEPRRLLINNDGTNLLWRSDLTLEIAARQVAECPNAVTTYLLCPNGIQKMMYPTEHGELSTRGALPGLVAAGEDPFGAVLAGLKQRGFETFVTFRMNEVHNVNKPDEPDLSTFWREHPEYRVERGEKPGDWMAQCLDYSVEPVREYVLALIFELLEKYQPDGIELDWMRFPRHLSGTPEEVWEKRGALTEVVTRVRVKADELSAALGRPIRVSVRVPTSLAGCRALGADIVSWNENKLIDFVTAAPFLASDFTMPLTEMREALQGHPIPIYGCIEFGYSGKPHREETIRAAALGLFASGADGIYLFNFPCWRESLPHNPWSWVPQLKEPGLMKGRDLTFPVINNMHRVGGVDLPAQLPVEIPAGEKRTVTLELPRAAFMPGNRPNAAHVSVEPAEVAAAFNGTAMKPDGRLPLKALKAGANEITLENTGQAAVSVSGVELSLGYPVVSPLARAPEAAAFYVSPDGSDKGEGTLEQPFRTLERARKAVRKLKEKGENDITVLLRGGTYRINKPVEFGPEDSGMKGKRVLYRAYPGETPVISGGRSVTGWAMDEAGRWKSADAPRNIRQLYVNGKRAIRARGECPEGVELFGSLDARDADAGFVFPDGGMAGWRNPGDIELGFYNSWGHMICKVDNITRALSGGAMLHMKQPWYFLAARKEGVRAEMPSYVENALELLDAPGEWYLDRAAGVLYYLPREGEDMTQAEVVAPVLETLLRVAGTPAAPVRNLGFEGITFADATWMRPSRIGHADVQANFTIGDTNLYARDGCVLNTHNEYGKSPANVVVSRVTGCRFERCTFTRLGGAGLDIENGSQNTLVNACEFVDISGSGIQVGDVRAADHHPANARNVVRNNRITNTRIHEIGVEYQDSVGVFLGYTDGTVIAHNEIWDLPYSGISAGWGWGEEDPGGGCYSLPYVYATPTPSGGNRIEANHIHHVMLKRNDGGGIYTLGNQPGTVIRENHIHDNGPDGPGGIYLDEGSGYIEITGNAVYNVPTEMNYNNRCQDRIDTCFEHDNFFGLKPEDAEFPKEIAEKAGVEKGIPREKAKKE